jgi:hypothetical protein
MVCWLQLVGGRLQRIIGNKQLECIESVTVWEINVLPFREMRRDCKNRGKPSSREDVVSVDENWGVRCVCWRGV